MKLRGLMVCACVLGLAFVLPAAPGHAAGSSTPAESSANQLFNGGGRTGTAAPVFLNTANQPVLYNTGTTGAAPQVFRLDTTPNPPTMTYAEIVKKTNEDNARITAANSADFLNRSAIQEAHDLAVDQAAAARNLKISLAEAQAAGTAGGPPVATAPEKPVVRTLVYPDKKKDTDRPVRLFNVP